MSSNHYVNKSFGKSHKKQINPFCGTCHKAGKPTDHWTRSVPGPLGVITCPLILSTECGYCHELGHWAKFCPKIKSKDVDSVEEVNNELVKESGGNSHEEVKTELVKESGGNSWADVVKTAVIPLPPISKIIVKSPTTKKHISMRSWADSDSEDDDIDQDEFLPF